MALLECELEALISDLENQRKALSREYSETTDKDLRADLGDVLDSLDYQISRLEDQWAVSRGANSKTATAGA